MHICGLMHLLMCREVDRRNGIGSRRYRGDREDRDYLRSEEREKRRREVAAARRMPMDDGDLLEELRARAFETGALAPHPTCEHKRCRAGLCVRPDNSCEGLLQVGSPQAPLRYPLT